MSRLVEPIAGTLDIDVDLPGSKSLTNRALVIAGLASGQSTLTNLGVSDDTRAMLDVLEGFGVAVELTGTTAVIEGSGGMLQTPGTPLDANMSGTTARFAAPMLLRSGGGTLTAHEQMRGRPMGELLDAMRDLGADVDGDALPITVHPVATLGSRVTVASQVSSQFISGLLLVAPALPDGLVLHLDGEVVSRPYIQMTLRVMRTFGAKADWIDDNTIEVAPGGYGAADFAVEPDASTASYPLAAAAIVGGRVRVNNLGSDSAQGDVGFADVIRSMGADVDVAPNHIEVRGSGALQAIDVDLGPMSDTAPTFAALAARADGQSSVTGIGFIRTTKESDRLAASVAELQRLGIEASIDDDGFTVVGGPHQHAEVETYEDHRMAMSMALLGLADTPVTILDPGCVAKTFPEYFDMLDDFRRTARTAPLVLAIDGPAGSGKSTVTSMVAERLRLPHLDTGAMYRSVALAVLRSGVGIDNTDAVTKVAERAVIHVGSTVTIDGEDVTEDIRTPKVTSSVSPVSAISGVRRVLAARQRQWAVDRGAAVVEGRDIGSAVFPEATLKIYLTASVDERARRRAAQTGDTDLEDMRRRIAQRDEIDSTREHDPLTIADDAEVIDSTDMDISAVVDLIVERWSARLQEIGAAR
jgi:3-phosphoshikimate 1-carboxyvinyltransferase